MASNINPNNVNGTFPVAGQDNSSQGFRDNFTNIKNNLIFAQAEITDLQSKAILTSALSGQTINNDMAGTVLRRPQLAAWTQTLLDQGTGSGNITLDFNQANFQKFTTAGAVSVSFINWPTSTGVGALGYGVMRIWAVITNVAHTVTLPTSVSIAVGDIAGYNAGNQTITFDAPGNYIFDISSIDGGETYQIFDVTRNRSSFRDPNLYFNAAVTSAPTLFVGYGANGGGTTALDIAIAGDQGQNIVSSLGSYNSVAVGNLTLGNVVNPTLDTGKIGGYTITAARGNLATGTIQGVQNGDYLGYYNAVAYTGNGSGGNTFQQTSSIVFYAVGPSQTAGLGGNIAFYTAVPNDGGSQNAVQAMSINNDQTVEVVGLLQSDGGIAERGTYVVSMATTGAATFVGNTAVSTLIIDSINSATIATANILLPTNPYDKQRFRISTVAPITNANVYGSNGVGGVYPVKYLASNYFTAGNIAVQLTYNASNTTWYRS